MNILQTDRLILREFTTGDAAFIIELLNSPGWIRFIGDRNIKTTEQAVSYLANGPLKSYAENGYGLCMVEMKDDKKPIGMCGIIRRDNLEHPDIGFAFLPGYMGKGYAFEIASATRNHAHEILKIKIIQAITVPANGPSIKLLEKIGLKFENKFSLPGSTEELLLYSSES